MGSKLLFICGANLDTFANVLWALGRHLAPDHQIAKVTVLESERPAGSTFQRTAEADMLSLANLANAALGDTPEIRLCVLGTDIEAQIPSLLVDGATEMGTEGLVVDLISGTKTISAVLYASASLSRLKHVYYVNVQRTSDGFPRLWETANAAELHNVVALSPLRDVQRLAAQSFFDLIFYMDKLDEIEKEATQTCVEAVREAANEVRLALSHFFAHRQSLHPAMVYLGKANECVLPALACELSRVSGSDCARTQDAIDNWAKAHRNAVRRGTAQASLRALAGLLVVDAQLNLVRHLRNGAAHSDPPDLAVTDVRSGLASLLSLLETLVRLGRLPEGGATDV